LVVDSFVGGADDLAIGFGQAVSISAKHLQADHMICRVASFKQPQLQCSPEDHGLT
jgi:hypothetical protein